MSPIQYCAKSNRVSIFPVTLLSLCRELLEYHLSAQVGLCLLEQLFNGRTILLMELPHFLRDTKVV